MSVYVLAGSALTGVVTFEGPLLENNIDNKIDSGMALQNAIKRMEHGREKHPSYFLFTADVDFEHLNIGESDDDAVEEDEEDIPEDETTEQRRERRARQRKKALEARQRNDERRRKQRRKIREEGEPFQHTIEAPAVGWYRYCVKSQHDVTVEIDLRKESEMGGVDEDGNVWTIRQKAMEDEERYLEEDTAASEGIKDEDFQSTRDKLKTLRRLLADIQSKQSQERHRLLVHAATNEHSHSRMVLSSLLETILFMGVTGFQVYTIRKWFSGAPVLGR